MESTLERRSGSEKLAKIMTAESKTQLVKLFDHKCGISQPKATRIINSSPKTKTSTTKREEIKVPKRHTLQKFNIRRLLCRQLYQRFCLGY